MSIVLSVGPVSIELPDDLYWTDEYTWSPVAQTVRRSVTGALILQLGQAVAGRPITLEPPIAERSGWIHRAALDQLYAWASVSGQQMQLQLRGVTRTVVWRHQDGTPIAARVVQHWTDVQSDDVYSVALKFMEI